jgi:uncharacterized MAPEG superfamily protein
MSTELVMLTASATLCALLFVPYGAAQSTVWGLRVSLGNREVTPPLPAWAERAVRAHRNMLESLPHFAALVLVAVVTDKTNAMTAAGATVFFWSRLAHAGLYIAGVPALRTLAFFAGLAGEGLILAQLL